ncbi:hypothetical protein COL154_013964, partial [Colletotrichum chrysophilum]
AKSVTVKVKYADFSQVTRAHTGTHNINFIELKDIIPMLLARTEAGSKPIRLVGLSLSGFDYPEPDIEQSQLALDLTREF